MSSNTVGDDVLLRAALESLTACETSYGKWLATAEAQWMLDAIGARIGEVITARFSRQHGMSFDVMDVVNTAVTVLANESALDALSAATDQWAYLYQILNNEMLKQMGTRGISVSEIEQVLTVDRDDDGMPDVDEAMDRTIKALRPLTPKVLRPHLREVVAHLAERGQSRISHAHTSSANDTGLIKLGLERHHILALANVVLGARPDHGHNSILAGFLQDPEWNPHHSIPHRIALKKYGARMKRVPAPEKKQVAAL